MRELEDMENSFWLDFNIRDIPRNQFTVAQAKTALIQKRQEINKKYKKLFKDRANPKKSEKAKLELHQILNDLDMDDNFQSFKDTIETKTGIKFQNEKLSKEEVEEFVNMLKHDEGLKKG